MRFDVVLVPSADGDLGYYRAYEQRIILSSIFAFLSVDANVESGRRRRLRSSSRAPWELRIGKFRAFYEVEGTGLVRVLAIGHKEHNDLFIRGKRAEV